MPQTYITHSDDETIALGRKLSDDLPKRGTALLIGNLGAGKTTLAKGIIQGRGAAQPEEVSSPTFTLIHEYGSAAEGNLVYHIDLYRLDSPRELATLGLDEIFDRNALVLIEWGERFPQFMPSDRYEIHLTRLSEDERRIELHSPRSL